MRSRINDICKEKGITQKELASKIGITPVGLNKSINGNPTKETLEKIADCLEVDISELFDHDNILKAKYGSDKTPLHLGNLEIPCYVLEDGTRVFSGRGIQKVLGSTATSGKWLEKFVNSDNILPYISCQETGDFSVLEKLSNPIKFYRPTAGGSQSTTYGYEVTLLIDLCDAIIRSYETGSLNDESIIKNANIIIRAVAKVGIIALVDEVTGYDKEKNRAKDELQKFLNQFISQEASKWVKTFNDSFFEMIYKMRDWDWSKTNKRPGVVGQWINNIVYERLGPNVKTYLEEVNPKNDNGNRKDRHHQYLTKDIGYPLLRERLAAIEALGKASGYNWIKFMIMLDNVFPRQNQQLMIDFNSEE